MSFSVLKPGINVYGTLIAEGTASDRIYFLSEAEFPDVYDWRGIKYFGEAIDSVEVSYCVVKHGKDAIEGYAIESFSVNNCLFALNSNGVDLLYSIGTINDCYFYQKGGILLHSSNISIQGNEFYLQNDQCAIETQESDLEIYDNTISGCVTGVSVSFSSYADVQRNLMIDNSKGILVTNGAHAEIYNNTLVGYTENAEEGIHCAGEDSVRILNNIVTGFEYGITFYAPESACIAHNDVFGNTMLDYENVPDYVGIISQTNINGDSCDIFFNISAEPLFVGGEPFDYNLTELSPCVEAGTDVGIPYFGSYPDIGAFESNFTGVSEAGLNLPGEFRLYQNYPNPFNAATTLSFNLSSAGQVSLKVFDITGREAASLVNGHLSLGPHSMVWDAEGMASGVYFVRLEMVPATESRHHTNSQTRKVLLMK